MIAEFPAEPPRIETDDFVIRGIRRDDVSDLWETLRDDDTVKWWMADHVIENEDDTAAFIDSAMDDWKSGDVLTFVVEVGGRLSGMFRLRTVKVDRQLVYLSYVLSPWARGGNLTVKVFKHVRRWTFTQTSLTQINGIVAKDNDVSYRTALECGFSPIGGFVKSLGGVPVRLVEGAIWKGCSDI